MTPGRIKWVVALSVGAALDIALTLRAILTRHTRPPAVTATVSTGSPKVMSVADALGCLVAFLLLTGVAVVIADGVLAERKRAAAADPAIRVIEIANREPGRQRSGR